jgi:outer membrane lipoprotein-sorting protein
MKTVFLFVILYSIFCGHIISQDRIKLSEKEKQSFEQKIIEESKKIKTLQCDFVQEKISTLVSEKSEIQGVLLYKSPSKLRWEYTTFTPSTLILNGNNAVLLNKNGEKIGEEKLLKQLGGIIISMINSSSITNNKQFVTEYYANNKTTILVVLIPIQKRLKDFYNKIEIKMDINTMLADEIILDEKTGDKTIIYLSNKILNAELLETKFNIQ